MLMGVPEPHYSRGTECKPEIEHQHAKPREMTGSLHIHNFYIGKLKAKEEQLFESDPDLAMLLLSEHAEVLAEDIADLEDDDT